MPSETLDVIDRHESAVRSYVRAFPEVFTTAKGHVMRGESGREYIDFFAGAGALNYGHNDDGMKRALLDYIASDGVTHSLDMATTAKGRFLERFHEVILAPRGLDHRVLFPGPTGTNAVETALKLARKVTGREKIVSFTNGFHGMTLGSLSVTGNGFKRGGAGLPLDNAVFMPFDDFMGDGFDGLSYLEHMLSNGGSGLDLPAGVIVETVQGEGGINAASFDWLKRLSDLCARWDLPLILDDIQAGCGRTGTFFSFEPAGIKPDIICLSKSLSGYGLPMSVVLVRPDMDVFGPGEHNGTFRGNAPAFITATEALRFWTDDTLSRAVEKKGAIIEAALTEMAERHPELKPQVRGRGLMRGLALHVKGVAEAVCAEAFRNGVIMETSGPDSEVAKLLPSLTIPEEALRQGLEVMAQAVDTAAAQQAKGASQAA
ncbi:diaminobutyrate--2-oxoglutarate transaminase [Roseospira marina]|uniref:Diaminobutyrate--2-oxoglutarate transaminase n=1 Tax=Roseospira marina TaxID=140057 RepID=A0A5M6IG84_9PROT|nr:diaminobutyrate--2-oxoglutarate transaminase [Roseospira marina]KAA5607331.1 diaminobutyrate--2-oxoglutarate transaminase [Roseospira marina]MBB4312506.1 diaminobutyrate-2-oxoglutarate transaminase [Roseospira marina]MBB5085478.1 diaminobutyrate-2-oxoglutarate transaminase [Roseospira marina]